MKYRAEIDGLRAVAVVPVILFHAGFTLFKGGYVGVDVFFVISGYLITTIILDEMRVGRFSILKFYERRARRILPALFFVCLCSTSVAWILLVPRDMEVFGQSLFSVATFSSNFYFLIRSGYFDVASELQPLLHTWSLAVEEQYYILFPLFLLLIWRFGWKILVLSLTGLGMASLGVSTWASYHAPSVNFYLLPTRAWELLIGSIVAVYLQNFTIGTGRKINDPLAFLGLAGILLAAFLFDKSTPFPGIYGIVPTVGTALIILFAQPGTLVQWLLSRRLFVGIGLISYSAYLWHQPVFTFYRYAKFDGVSETQYLFLILLVFVLSLATFKFVETPARKSTRISQTKIFAAAAVSAGCLAIIGLSGHLTDGFPSRAGMAKYDFLTFNGIGYDYHRCDDSALLSFDINFCYQSSDQTPTAALIGDSHADDKFEGIQKSLPQYDWIMIGNSACAPVLNVIVEGPIAGCYDKVANIFEYVSKNSMIDLAVISFAGNYPLSAFAADHVTDDSWKNGAKISSRSAFSGSPVDVFYYGLDSAVKKLVSANKQVVVLSDIPEVPVSPIKCVQHDRTCQTSWSVIAARQDAMRKALNRIAEENDIVGVFNPNEIFCDDTSCSIYSKRENLQMYRDSNHLNPKGSELYGRYFRDWLHARLDDDANGSTDTD